MLEPITLRQRSGKKSSERWSERGKILCNILQDLCNPFLDIFSIYNTGTLCGKRYLRDEWTASICILKNTDVKHTPMVLAGSVQKLCPKLGSRCRGPVVEVKCSRKISASIGGGETCQAHCEQSCAAHA